MCFRALALLLLTMPLCAAEHQWQLQVTPERCVTLEQGRLCYATVQVHWQGPPAQQVCLQLADVVLQCWSHQNTANWQFEFAASESQPLQLLADGQLVAQRPLEVSWVQQHKAKKRYWRLF